MMSSFSNQEEVSLQSFEHFDITSMIIISIIIIIIIIIIIFIICIVPFL